MVQINVLASRRTMREPLKIAINDQRLFLATPEQLINFQTLGKARSDSYVPVNFLPNFKPSTMHRRWGRWLFSILPNPSPFILSSLCVLAHKASKKCFQLSRLATTVLTLSHNCHPATFLSFLTVSLECYQVSWIKMKKLSLLQLYLHVLIDSISRICRVTFRDFVAYSKKK